MRHQDNSECSRLIIITEHTKDGDNLRVIEEKTKTHEAGKRRGIAKRLSAVTVRHTAAHRVKTCDGRSAVRLHDPHLAW